VRLDVRRGPGRSALHDVPEAGYLVGSVPGCDLRLPGTDLPPVICLITRHAAGASLRKLVPTYPILVNGRVVTACPLQNGDRVTLGAIDLMVQVQVAAMEPEPAESDDVDARRHELESVRAELTSIRQQLYERYRERRTRLVAMRAAVRRAAQKVQDEKRRVSQDAAAAQPLPAASERQLVEQREALAREQAQYREDLVRLDRLQANLEQRQHQLQERAREIDLRSEQQQRTGRELEEQARQLDAMHEKLRAESERLTREKGAQEAAAAAQNQRVAALEGQQAMLASLRTRLERMREELRQERQQLATQQARLDTAESDLRRRTEVAEQLRTALDAEKQLGDAERRRFEERRTALETAVAQLRQVQDAVAEKEKELQEKTAALETSAQEQARTAEQHTAEAARLAELGQRTTTDREALREREAALLQAEQAREALQEQLRRRSEELAGRQKTLADQERQLSDQLAGIEARRAEIETSARRTADELATLRRELDSRAAALARGEEQLQKHFERLRAMGRQIGAARKAFRAERLRWEADQQEAAEAAARSKAELTSARREVEELGRQFPDLELQAQTAVERLAEARGQLREHLAELHAYAHQSQEDTEAFRTQVRVEAEQVQQQRLAVQRAREEHRLAVAAFRQQLIEWHGQIADMKRTLATGETRLERRQAQVNEQARQIDATSARLAEQAEQLQEQERIVVERREEMEKHLDDMREWYRQKLREMSERRRAEEESSAPTPASAVSAEEAPAILTLTDEVDTGDKKLGDLLRALDLVDAETLTALLVEARRQRRSLRQALLAGGYLTLYQMALIETGDLDALVLGPLRVIDRLRMTAHESVYRVFDPRRGQEAILRHLAESEMEDAVHPDEFRQRFGQAALVRHPHLAETLEVLDIAGRPAVLLEAIIGLPGTDWPALAGVPGVWYRLIHQVALGLHAAHQAGLFHGHLQPAQLLLTSDGALKLAGWGEPPWLSPNPATDPAAADAAGDLAALGQMAAAWAALPGRRKSKALPEPLQTILDRLTAAGAEARYTDAGALLQDLDRAGENVPANPEAWDRLLRHVREHAAEGRGLRRSA
jgi:uncharacterized phage infection (PIP) family protein YhgE